MGRRRTNIKRDGGRGGVESEGGRIGSEKWRKDAIRAKGAAGDDIDGRGCD
jgi:hypothetical protein